MFTWRHGVILRLLGQWGRAQGRHPPGQSLRVLHSLAVDAPGAPAHPALPAAATMEPLFPASPLTSWNASSAATGSGGENGTLAGLVPSPGARAVVVPVLYLLVCTVGLGGNALVIYVVYCVTPR